MDGELWFGRGEGGYGFHFKTVTIQAYVKCIIIIQAQRIVWKETILLT